MPFTICYPLIPIYRRILHIVIILSWRLLIFQSNWLNLLQDLIPFWLSTVFSFHGICVISELSNINSFRVCIILSTRWVLDSNRLQIMIYKLYQFFLQFVDHEKVTKKTYTRWRQIGMVQQRDAIPLGDVVCKNLTGIVV